MGINPEPGFRPYYRRGSIAAVAPLQARSGPTSPSLDDRYPETRSIMRTSTFLALLALGSSPLAALPLDGGRLEAANPQSGDQETRVVTLDVTGMT